MKDFKTEQIRLIKAKKKVRKLRDFYIMFSGILLLTPFLIYLNLNFTPDFYWFWYPIFGFAISIFIFGFDLFGIKNWEEKQIQNILDREKHKIL